MSSTSSPSWNVAHRTNPEHRRNVVDMSHHGIPFFEARFPGWVDIVAHIERCGDGRRPRAPRCSLSVQGPRGKRAIRVVVVVGRGRDPWLLVLRRRRRPVTPGAARRAERVALDRRRGGAIGRCVRAGARPYLGPRPGVAPGRRHDGCWGDPADCVAAARSFRAVHAHEGVTAGACREPAAVHRCDEGLRAHDRSFRRAAAPPRRALAACGSCA
jgi:hypothetical protein